MNLYLGASALVKIYLNEPGTPETRQAAVEAGIVATSLISRAEAAAAFSRYSRLGVSLRDTARAALDAFREDWPDYVRLHVTETLVGRAESLGWEHGLRGYDAIHLATALIWKEAMNESITFAAFDVPLWRAAGDQNLDPWPADLPELIRSWQR